MLVVLALPGLWLALRRPRVDAAGDLVRALADRLRARRPLPRPLLRRAADAALRARRAHAGGRARRGSGSRSALAALVLPVYKAWPAYTAGGTRERSLASTLGLAHRHGRRRGPLPARAHAPGRPRLRALRRREPLPRGGPALALSVPLVPRHRSTSRARCSGCATRSPGPDAPRYIAVYQQPRTIDKRGDIGRILTRRYRHVATIEGVPIWRLRVPERQRLSSS